MTIQTKEQAQAKARALSKHLATQGIHLGYRKCLDAIAAIEGLKNWNTLSATLTPAPQTAKPKSKDLWTAEVVRVSAGRLDFVVEADSLAQALDLAYSKACDSLFSPADSSWYLASAYCNGKAVQVPPHLQPPEMEPMEPSAGGWTGRGRYSITVSREGVAHGEVTFLNAHSCSDEEVLEELLARASDLSPSENSSEYKLQVADVEPAKD